MMRNLVLCLCAGFVLAMVASMGHDGAFGGEKPKYNIKEVMKEAHKGGLLNKVKKGEGDKKDAERLVELYTALSKNSPPQGDKESFKKFAEAALKGAKDAAKGDLTALKKGAVDCKGCHGAHK